MKKTKQLLPLVMAIVMMAMWPQRMWAISGTGAYGNPYLISSASDWDTFRTNVSSASTSTYIYAKLTADFTIASGSYTPVGTSSKPFHGELDGNNKTITLTNAQGASNDFGLFGWINAAYILNLKVYGTITVSGTRQHIGGIVGSMRGESIIKGCTFRGTIDAGSSYNSNGGIVGYAENGFCGSITKCFCKATFKTTTSDDNPTFGGILGYFNDESSKKPAIQHNFSDFVFLRSGKEYVSNYTNGIIGRIRAHADNVWSNYSVEKINVRKACNSDGPSIASSNASITISVVSNNNVIGTVSQSYIDPSSSAETRLQVTATPNSGKYFIKWSDGGEQTHTVGLESNVDLKATFEEHFYTSKTTTSAYLRTAATCNNRATYYYKCIGCDAKGTEYYSSDEAKDKALGHDYAAAVWKWADDGHSTTCSITCKRSSCTSGTSGRVLSASLTYPSGGITGKETTAPTCFAKGTTTYTGNATVNGTQYTATKKVQDIPVRHIFNTTADPNQTSCTKCSHSFLRYTATAKVTPDTNSKFRDAKGSSLTYTNSFSNGVGEIEFNGTLARTSANFRNNTDLTTVIIPNSMTNIGENTFMGCTSLTSVTIPNSVTTIEVKAFAYCTSLASVTIPNSVTSAADNAFEGCTAFPTDEYGVRYADTYLIKATKELNGVYNIKDGTRFIGFAAFLETGNLSNVFIPNSVIRIGEAAFQGCTFSRQMFIPISVTSIGNCAFEMACSEYHFQSIPETDDGIWGEKSGARLVTLELTDDSYIASDLSGFIDEIKSMSYTRSGIKNQWGTLVVPFPVSATTVSECDFYQLSKVSRSTLTLTKLTGTIPASTPVIVRMSEDGKNGDGLYKFRLSYVSKRIDVDIKTGSSAGGLTLTGTYRKTNINTQTGYFMSGDKFYNIADYKTNNINLGPFRAYLKGSLSSGVKELTFGELNEDNEDGLEALEALTSGDAIEVYDTNGRKLNDLQPGVNIVRLSNGKTKKVILK